MRRKMLVAMVAIVVLGTGSVGTISLVTGADGDATRVNHAAAGRPAVASSDGAASVPVSGPARPGAIRGPAPDPVSLPPEVIAAALSPPPVPAAPAATPAPPLPSSSVRRFRASSPASGPQPAAAADRDGLRGMARVAYGAGRRR